MDLYHQWQNKFYEEISKFVINGVSTDGLAIVDYTQLKSLYDLILSYLTMMTKFKSHMYVGQALTHYDDAIMSAMASQITGVLIVYLTVSSGPDQRKHQNSTSLAFVWGIHR